MRLFLYYTVHTFINTIQKLLKTWVACMLILMVVAGVLMIAFIWNMEADF